MDFFLEFIGELLLEGGEEAARNKKLSKWIRYPLLGTMLTIYFGISIGLIVLGFFLARNNLLGGGILFGVGVFLLIGYVIKAKKLFK